MSQEQILSTNVSQPSTARWQMLGGDRFYTLARWAVLALMFLVGRLLSGQPFWPPSLAMSPIMLLVWAYFLFNVLATVALFLPPLSSVLSGAFVVDIIFFTLFT